VPEPFSEDEKMQRDKVFIWGAVGIVFLTTASPAAGNSPVLENSLVRMVFDQHRGHLLSFIDKQTATELFSNRQQAWPVIFGLGYTVQDGNQLWTDSNGAKTFSYTIQLVSAGTEYTGLWQHQLENGSTTVTLTVYLPSDSSFSTWTVQVTAQGNITLDHFVCPLLPGIGKLGDSSDDDRLLVPDQNGRLFINPLQRAKHWGQTYPSGFANMQFMAYFDSLTGFYLASLDAQGISKGLSWDSKERDWAAWAINHLGLLGTGNEKSFQVEATLGVFHGDWTTAASIYRAWAQQQPWAKSTIKSKGTPAWSTKIGIAKDYYVYEPPQRTYDDWVRKIEEHRSFFGVPTQALLWGWENGGSWAAGDYFPPQKGWAPFDAAMQQVKALDAIPYLFIAAASLRRDSPAAKSEWASLAAIRHADLLIPEGQYLPMCLESDLWLSYLEETVRTLTQHGTGLVQLDGLPWSAATLTCYAQNHKHGAVPGCAARPYQVVDNLVAMRQQLKTDYPNLALSGEGGAELYLPVFDVLHSRDCWAEVADFYKVGSGLAEVVPLFHYVYHPNIIFLDQYNLGLWDFLGGTTYHNLAVGRCFVWGEICSYNMQDWLADYGAQPVFGLLKRCAEARVGYLKDFLIFGQMLPPPKVDAPTTEVESPSGEFKDEVASVLTSAWKSEQGDLALIVLNIGQRTLNTSVFLAPYASYAKPGSRLKIYRNSELIGTKMFDVNSAEEIAELEPLQFAAFILSTHRGDFGADGDVDFKDFAVLASTWASNQDEDCWNPICDVNEDSRIDMLDLSIFVQSWLASH